MFSTIVFMDMVRFSTLATHIQKEKVSGLTAVVSSVLTHLMTCSEAKESLIAIPTCRVVVDEPGTTCSEAKESLIAIPTGDGMALGFLNNVTVGLLLEVIEKAKKWAFDQNISLRIGINSGEVEIIKDINVKNNFCGHAINDAQRVMDASNDDGVLWSMAAVEHHFGKSNHLNVPEPYEFLNPEVITVKHEIDIWVRQLVRKDKPEGWDNTQLKSLWKNSFSLSSRPWSQIEHLDDRFKSGRDVAMVHINGAVFRDRRWQLGSGSKDRRTNEIEKELGIEEKLLTNELENLYVFVPNRSNYNLYKDENPKATIEEYDLCLDFWKAYLKKLCEERVESIKENIVTTPLNCRLFIYSTIGSILYYFNWNCPGGLIRGAPYVWGVELIHSSNFEIRWRGNRKPPAFQEYVTGLNYLTKNSMPSYHSSVDATGDFKEHIPS